MPGVLEVVQGRWCRQYARVGGVGSEHRWRLGISSSILCEKGGTCSVLN